MKNISSFSDFDKVNEALSSSIIRKMNLSASEFSQLRGYIDFANIKDSDIKKIDTTEANKKIYTNDHNKFIILVAGNYEYSNPNFSYDKPRDEPGNERELTKYGLLYTIMGKHVNRYNGPWDYKSGGKRGRGKSVTPSKPSVLARAERNNYDLFLINTDLDKLNKQRNDRNTRQSDAFVDTNYGRQNRAYSHSKERTVLDWKNDSMRTKNRERYADALKKKLNFDNLYNAIDKKMIAFVKENEIVVEFLKYYGKYKDEKGKILYNEIDKALRVDFALVKTMHDKVSYGFNDKVRTKIDFLTELSKLTATFLLSKSSTYSAESEKNLNHVKSFLKIVESLPEYDMSDFNKFITDQKWQDSDKLKHANANSGLFEN